jgi:hypothetical protein
MRLRYHIIGNLNLLLFILELTNQLAPASRMLLHKKMFCAGAQSTDRYAKRDALRATRDHMNAGLCGGGFISSK